MSSDGDQAAIDQHDSKPATFQGRLQLQDFMHTSTEPRRSLRISKTSDVPSKPVPSVKRKSNSSTPEPKRKKRSSGYAPPSTYAHLDLLPDAIADNLLVMFVGLNPGISTARQGHAYAHPSNLFWKLLFSSGITPRRVDPSEDGNMPQLYSLGLTNIVSRPSRNGGELKNKELDDGVHILEEKASKYRPESVCIVGKSIWESIWRVRHGKPVGKAFKYGWQDESENMGVIEDDWPGARVFVATSTSGLAASMSKEEKEKIWNALGSWVLKRRSERELLQQQ